ncbi:MAG: hypothetical protein DRQ55_05325 [Planctomycetota bacterium]|nr:MAG: hypothetical protein DRQ55_05325 [Planctomycetota bacterium]
MLLSALALVLLGLPASSMWLRDIVHFYSAFNAYVPHSAGGSGPGSILVLGGGVEFSGVPGVFDLDLSGTDGVLIIKENAQALPAQMMAHLDQPAVAGQINVSFDLGMLNGPSGLVVFVSDDDGGGMIDLVFDDQGRLRVGASSVIELTGAPGSSEYALHADLMLRQGLLGMNTWMLSLRTPNGTVVRSGVLSSVGPLSVGGVGVTRPGLSSGGTWRMDNLLVTSPVPGNAASSQ